jgi:hypothetical protein
MLPELVTPLPLLLLLVLVDCADVGDGLSLLPLGPEAGAGDGLGLELSPEFEPELLSPVL